MYLYNKVDQKLVDDRVAQFRGQTERFLSGRLSEDDFRPLRLQNGLYVQRHSPMLRIAIPYGLLSSRQMRMLAHIARTYDRGYGHFTTRCNIQFNWVRLNEAPDILAELATVQMHAIQTSGNCIRNITCDSFAGVGEDEIFDTRPYCEIARQWSTLAPEFMFLPRKFKIAFAGGAEDRAAVRFYDIGVRAKRSESGEDGFEIFVGGGMGRTPMLAQSVKSFLQKEELLNYFDAILRVYNRHGRRDNKYKARIKILVKDLSVEGFAKEVDAEWQHLKGGAGTISAETIATMTAFFEKPAYQVLGDNTALVDESKDSGSLNLHREFTLWKRQNVSNHQHGDYAIVSLSLKKTGVPPGDATARQMEFIADLADRFSLCEVRVTHEQNLLLPHVPRIKLYELWNLLASEGLATPNIGLMTDMVCCPGGDFCSLANAKSIPIAVAIQQRFDDLDYLFDLGPLELNISGCVNSCGHHHIGHIGILGVDKNSEEWYQITLGGREGNASNIGKVIGPSFAAHDIPNVIDKIIGVYIANRYEDEIFIDTFTRIGMEPFKSGVYGAKDGSTH